MTSKPASQHGENKLYNTGVGAVECRDTQKQLHYVTNLEEQKI
jgi:hypothetical protein